MSLNQTQGSLEEEFIDEQEKENTKKKTKHDFALFHEFLVMKGETREIYGLIAHELNKFLRKFLTTVCKTKRNTILFTLLVCGSFKQCLKKKKTMDSAQ